MRLSELGRRPSILKSGRVSLSDFHESDISKIYLEWLNDPVVVLYSNQRFVQHTQESSLAYLQSFQNSENYFFKVTLNSDEKTIGTITIYQNSNHGTADIGIMIGDKNAWGQGYGAEAFSLASDFAENDLNLRKITAGTLETNIGMRNVLERSGFHLEARRVRQETQNGQPVDVLYFAKFCS